MLWQALAKFEGDSNMKNITTENHTLAVGDGTSMNAFVARPADKGIFPGMLVFQEAFGVNGHIRDVAQRLARRRLRCNRAGAFPPIRACRNGDSVR